jgi:hypothetical protein
MPTGYDFATFETIDPRAIGDSDDAAAPGRPVAEKLRAAVSAAAQVVVSEVGEHDAYGWTFEVKHQGVRVWCMLQRSDAWLLTTEVRPSFLDRLSGRDFAAQHREVGKILDQAVRSLANNVHWYDRAEFLSQTGKGAR